jgi:hypothetical protein
LIFRLLFKNLELDVLDPLSALHGLSDFKRSIGKQTSKAKNQKTVVDFKRVKINDEKEEI